MSSTKSVRQEESILTVLAKIGGILNVLNKMSVLINSVVGKYYYLAKQISMLTFNTQDYQKVDKFQKWGFQCRFFCFKRLLCSPKKWCRVFKEQFYNDVILFEKETKKFKKQMSIKHVIKFRFQQIKLVIEIMNCLYQIVKEQASEESQKIFEYFLNTLQETIANAEYVNTDDEDNEEKDVVEIHKSIINEKLRNSVNLACAVPEGLVRKKNQSRRKTIVKKSIN